MKYRTALLAAVTLVWAAAATAQTTTPNVPEGVTFTTVDNARVNGVRIRVADDGAVWFLESSADVISRLKDGVIRNWQIRPNGSIGANPVDFQLDGNLVWFIESGQSGIPSGTCAYARLDTTTNQLTQWQVPGTIPAAFYRAPAPDTKVWLPQSGAVMQSFDLNTLQVDNYRSSLTYAYADMVVAPDGAFWLADFGDNRIVRWVPGAATETSWTFFPLSGGRLYPSQIAFDEQGYLWISQRGSALFPVNAVARFNAATGELRNYTGITNPIHFDIYDGRLYVTSIADPSAIYILDPALLVATSSQTLVPLTLDVGHSVSQRAAIPLDPVVITPTDLASAPVTIAPGDFAVTAPSPGIVKVTFPFVDTWAITVAGGRVWTGTDSKLAALNLQTIGAVGDLSAPNATSLTGPPNSRIQVNLTAANLGASSISGQSFYLYSPAAYAPKTTFTLAAGATTLFADAYGNLAGTSTLLNGPVRLGVTSGTAASLEATVRSVRVLPSGGTFGYLLPAASAAGSQRPGTTTTLFGGASSSETSILSLYALEDAQATLSLVAPDGTARGSRTFSLGKNGTLLFNPAASAFGAAAEPGDVVRSSVATGSLQEAMLVFDGGTTDIAPALPAAAMTQAVIPYAGSLPGDPRSLVSDLYLSNPSADTAADVSVSYAAIGATGAPQVATLTLAPLQSQAIADVLPTLFAVPNGAGALLVSANVPVVSAVRIASSEAAGSYGTFANAFDGAGGIAGGQSGTAIGLPQTATQTSYLLLYNSGAAGTVTVNGFRADGAPVGHFDVPLGSQAAGLVGSPFAALGISNQPAGRIRIDVPAGMQVFAWAAAMDTVTGDIDISPVQ